jgi:hypothetical protein
VNPHTEETLKGNSENSYCRAHQYELVRHVYLPELDEYWKWVTAGLQSSQKKPWSRPASFTETRNAIQERFYAAPLSEMAPRRQRSAGRLGETMGQTRDLIAKLLAATP